MKKLESLFVVLAAINFSIYAQVRIADNHNAHQSSAPSIEQLTAMSQMRQNVSDFQLAWNENKLGP